MGGEVGSMERSTRKGPSVQGLGGNVWCAEKEVSVRQSFMVDSGWGCEMRKVTDRKGHGHQGTVLTATRSDHTCR